MTVTPKRPSRSPAQLALRLVAGLAVLGTLAFWQRARLRGPDVVLLTIDTLRADHVGALNPDSPAPTPNIDRLAADGVVYTQAWSPVSVTGPAFVTLHTGQDPGTHGVVMNLFRGGPSLPAGADTLAQHLATAHYRTGAFLSGFTLRAALGLRPGFQRYDATSAHQRRRGGDRTANLALRWMSHQPWNQRMFLWWHSYDAHGPLTPYDAAAPLAQAWARDDAMAGHIPAYQSIDGVTDPAFYKARYAAAVSFADAQVGRILDQLRQQGRYEQALIIVLADHGESLDERELWFDHGTHASAEQLHVPLIIKYPRSREAGSRVDALVGLQDVAPTVLAELGLAPLAAADGHAIGSTLRTQVVGESSHCKDEPMLDCAPLGPAGKEFSVRTAGSSWVRRSSRDGVRYDHYDRLQDPAELMSATLASLPSDAKLPALLDGLASTRSSAASLVASPGAEELPGAATLPETAAERAEREALEALGYVDAQSPAQ